MLMYFLRGQGMLIEGRWPRYGCLLDLRNVDWDDNSEHVINIFYFIFLCSAYYEVNNLPNCCRIQSPWKCSTYKVFIILEEHLFPCLSQIQGYLRNAIMLCSFRRFLIQSINFLWKPCTAICLLLIILIQSRKKLI